MKKLKSWFGVTLIIFCTFILLVASNGTDQENLELVFRNAPDDFDDAKACLNTTQVCNKAVVSYYVSYEKDNQTYIGTFDKPHLILLVGLANLLNITEVNECIPLNVEQAQNFTRKSYTEPNCTETYATTTLSMVVSSSATEVDETTAKSTEPIPATPAIPTTDESTTNIPTTDEPTTETLTTDELTTEISTTDELTTDTLTTDEPTTENLTTDEPTTDSSVADSTTDKTTLDLTTRAVGSVGLTTGAIVGIIIGVVASVALIIGLVYVVRSQPCRTVYYNLKHPKKFDTTKF